MLILSEKEIQRLYTMEDAISDVKEMLHQKQSGNVNTPERTVLSFPHDDASILYMPSAEERAAAVKVVSIFPHNPALGKPTTQGVMIFTDTKTGEHRMLCSATYLTRLRTGALSAIAADYLAKREASRLAVIGTGAMAREQVAGMLAVREIEHIFLYNRTRSKAEHFALDMQRMNSCWKGKVHIVDDANEAVRQADIVVCSTRSEQPVFSSRALQPGTHVSAIGSYLPHMRELDVETIVMADRIVVDTVEGAKHEAGELIQAAESGKWSFSRIDAEIGELVTGEKAGRQHEQEITLFKSVGAAFYDLAVAMGVYQKATELGAGQEIEL
ncbi:MULTISPECIES: NAD(P)-binding domain-containing protein [Geobacillus]|jgi:ornithine cyclodeaminase/alanine dehydrogenase-like protein (mu-crystallin family)|uniref:Ornithine cyclodeaminase/mu-crystallin family protein n=2 Tax=Geobacillus thermodenitrificans TaxID=33940 RepID=A4ILI1_GEOTN|nr:MULTISPECIES: NAD(P)-binding domain-containing protein [Geobacillus]ABO66185.1 Ornithine cyclodeaminase/mu-crystallin family protein [Geobacillus thermodenitrificans NG80-2]KQB94131.1 ornithine cyclodeaminase [Geobacillus sp. PA-3]MEC5188302.1 ornithine cyclodeaminase [Geobacillus thermodenitrificans]PJW21438.1 ornithine cyclodeaminase [Geobacillus thermodenitrificans]WMV77121.1 NAD(P)-binding domain-containing protein [Geobacillus thermodenitrificans]